MIIETYYNIVLYITINKVMLSTYKRNRSARTILESDIIHSRKTSYKEKALKSTINIVTII